MPCQKPYEMKASRRIRPCRHTAIALIAAAISLCTSWRTDASEFVLGNFGNSVLAEGWTWTEATGTLSGTEGVGAVLYPENFSAADLSKLGNPATFSLSLTGWVTTAPPNAFSITLEDADGDLLVTRFNWSSFASSQSAVIQSVQSSGAFDWARVAGWTLDSGSSAEPLQAGFTKLAVVAPAPTPSPTPSPTPTPPPSPTPSPTPTPTPTPSPSPTPSASPSPTPSPTPTPGPTPAPTPTPTPSPSPSPTPTPIPSPSPTPTPAPTSSPTPPPIAVPQERFDGLVGTGDSRQSAAEFLADNGLISIKTTTRGSFTGTLRLGADKTGFKGAFEASGSAQVKDLPRKSGQPAVDLTLQLGAGPKISGEVIRNTAPDLPFVALAPEPGSARKYTIALVPMANNGYAGYGYASLSTDSKGKTRLTGKLADGSKIAASSVISDGAGDGLPAERWLVPVFVSLDKAQGVLTGEMQVDKTEPPQGSSVGDGGQLWGWVQPGSSALAELAVKGRSFYVNKGISILTDTIGGGNFLVSGALANSPLGGFWPGSNKPSFQDTNDKLAFSASSGPIKGTSKDPKTTYEGIMFSVPINLTDGAAPVHGAGFRLNGPNNSLPVEIMKAP